jgi:catechol 2,3-dioxygenase-like lactoylglutathione lyase family enzyme
MLRKNIVGVDHIALQLPDLEEGLQFFNKLLGFKIKFQAKFEGRKVVMLQAGKIEIEMWEDKENADSSELALANGVHHIAVQVKKLDDVMTYVKEEGLEVLADIYQPTSGIREAIIRGPGGVRIQFVEQNIPLLIWRTIKGDFK